MAGVTGRRYWSLEEKRSIVAESFEVGISIAGVARRHDMNANLISTWVTVQPTRPTDDAEPVLRSVSLSVRPGHEVFKVGNLCIRDVGEDICEPGLRIDIVELGGLDEGVGDGRGLAAAG